MTDGPDTTAARSGAPSPERPAVDADRLRPPPAPWREVEVLPECPSTNAALAVRAAGGAAPGLVLVAEHQTAGRGRLDRTWETPARAALTLSALLDPAPVPPGRWPWLPLLAGVAVVDALGRAAGAVSGESRFTLKWPNDVLCSGDKVAGLLAERVERPGGGTGVVLGMGINVSTTRAELPVETATSLALAGLRVDRTTLLLEVLTELGRRAVAWAATSGDPLASGLLADYRRRCSTLGTEVRVTLPSGTAFSGIASDIAADGGLVVTGGTAPGGRVTVSAGDVVHVRPARRPPGAVG